MGQVGNYLNIRKTILTIGKENNFWFPSKGDLNFWIGQVEASQKTPTEKTTRDKVGPAIMLRGEIQSKAVTNNLIKNPAPGALSDVTYPMTNNDIENIAKRLEKGETTMDQIDTTFTNQGTIFTKALNAGYKNMDKGLLLYWTGKLEDALKTNDPQTIKTVKNTIFFWFNTRHTLLAFTQGLYNPNGPSIMHDSDLNALADKITSGPMTSMQAVALLNSQKRVVEAAKKNGYAIPDYTLLQTWTAKIEAAGNDKQKKDQITAAFTLRGNLQATAAQNGLLDNIGLATDQGDIENLAKQVEGGTLTKEQVITKFETRGIVLAKAKENGFEIPSRGDLLFWSEKIESAIGKPEYAVVLAVVTEGLKTRGEIQSSARDYSLLNLEQYGVDNNGVETYAKQVENGELTTKQIETKFETEKAVLVLAEKSKFKIPSLGDMYYWAEKLEKAYSDPDAYISEQAKIQLAFDVRGGIQEIVKSLDLSNSPQLPVSEKMVEQWAQEIETGKKSPDLSKALDGIKQELQIRNTVIAMAQTAGYQIGSEDNLKALEQQLLQTDPGQRSLEEQNLLKKFQELAKSGN